RLPELLGETIALETKCVVLFLGNAADGHQTERRNGEKLPCHSIASVQDEFLHLWPTKPRLGLHSTHPANRYICWAGNAPARLPVGMSCAQVCREIAGIQEHPHKKISEGSGKRPIVVSSSRSFECPFTNTPASSARRSLSSCSAR